MGAIDDIAAWWAAAQGRAVETAPIVELPPPEPLPPQHPYFPQDRLIPGYAENEAPLHVLLASFGGMLGFSILATILIARRINPRLSASSLAAVAWFALCKAVLNDRTMKPWLTTLDRWLSALFL